MRDSETEARYALEGVMTKARIEQARAEGKSEEEVAESALALTPEDMVGMDRLFMFVKIYNVLCQLTATDPDTNGFKRGMGQMLRGERTEQQAMIAEVFNGEPVLEEVIDLFGTLCQLEHLTDEIKKREDTAPYLSTDIQQLKGTIYYPD